MKDSTNFHGSAVGEAQLIDSRARCKSIDSLDSLDSFDSFDSFESEFPKLLDKARQGKASTKVNDQPRHACLPDCASEILCMDRGWIMIVS